MHRFSKFFKGIRKQNFKTTNILDFFFHWLASIPPFPDNNTPVFHWESNSPHSQPTWFDGKWTPDRQTHTHRHKHTLVTTTSSTTVPAPAPTPGATPKQKEPGQSDYSILWLRPTSQLQDKHFSKTWPTRSCRLSGSVPAPSSRGEHLTRP